jgi:hypothetical protein
MQWLSNRETSLGFIEKEEKKIRKIKFWRIEYGGERARGFISNWGSLV